MNTADLVNNSHGVSDRSLILMLALKVDEQQKEIISLKENQPLNKLAKGVSSWLPLMNQN